MTKPTTQELAMVQAYDDWRREQDRRVSHEWAKWDGSAEQADAINERQIARAVAQQGRMGLDANTHTRVRDWLLRGSEVDESRDANG